MSGNLRPGLFALDVAPKGTRGWMEWLAVLAFCALVTSGLIYSQALNRADNIVRDTFMSSQRYRPDDRIVVVTIDNRSLEALGRWPWPREVHARLLDRLTTEDVAAVGLDVLFVEASETDDPLLSQALARSQRACLPMAVQAQGQNGARWGELLPHPSLAGSAAGIGHVNLIPDDDGIIRKAPLAIHIAERRWTHLVLCMLETSGIIVHGSQGVDKTDSPSTASASGRIDGDDGLKATQINLSFPGEQGAFRTVSYIDVLNGETPSGFLKDRLVLVGMTADGQGDRHIVASPRATPLPGVEIQAALMDTLLSDRAIRSAPAWAEPVTALLFLLVLMLAFLKLSPKWGLAIAAGLIILALGLSAGLFAFKIWFAPLGIVSGLALACPLWSWRRLAAASAYMDVELRQFETEASDKGMVESGSGDVVSRQMISMQLALARLRGMNRFISDTLESLPDAAVVADADNNIIFANQRARALSPIHETRLTPVLAWLSHLHPDLPRMASQGGEVLCENGQALRLDSAPLNPDGTARRIIRLVDVTALKAAERQREEALQLLGHDMRAPQTAILTLLEGSHDRSDPRFFSRIASYARLTLRLSEAYVQLAKAEVAALNIEHLSLRDVVTDAIDILWPASEALKVKIVLSGTADPEIDADRSLLTRAVMNLLDNALQHSPAGEEIIITLAETSSESTIASNEAASGKVATVSVSDSGPGMDAHTFEHYLRPFQQGSARASGAGLGLAFVARVALRHKGSIHLVPAAEGPSSGATIVLTLPLR